MKTVILVSVLALSLASPAVAQGVTAQAPLVRIYFSDNDQVLLGYVVNAGSLEEALKKAAAGEWLTVRPVDSANNSIVYVNPQAISALGDPMYNQPAGAMQPQP